MDDENNCYYCGCPILDNAHFCKERECRDRFFAKHKNENEGCLRLSRITIFRKKHNLPCFRGRTNYEKLEGR